MGKGRPEKYNRITHHQKFMLRRLIVKEKLSVKQVLLSIMKAALSLGINYSTAKTIMFFSRKHSPFPSLSTYEDSASQMQASFVSILSSSSNNNQIKIVSTTGGPSWMKNAAEAL